MNFYCTLFNQNYMAKGLAMIESLATQSKSPFHLYLLAMDEGVAQFFAARGNTRITVVRLADFENADLLKIKPTRSMTEYCWTCTPAVIRYCLDTFSLKSCTYLDADLYFFNDPEILLDEVRKAKKSVLITPHAYTPRFDQTAASGIYCVQFMYFENNEAGRKVLERWYQQCIEWCYATPEDGKLGDQKYLDPWLIEYPGIVHSLQHWGACGPWNIQKFEVMSANGKMLLRKKEATVPVVFYHYHGFKKNPDGTYELGEYPYSRAVRELIYQPYIRHLENNQLPVDLNHRPRRLRARIKLWIYELFYWTLRA